MSPARGERRRAARGYTWDKCPGCKREPELNGYGRRKDSVCADCVTLLNEALDRRKFIARQEKTKWFGHNRMTHWNPYYYVGSYYSHNGEPDTRQLQQAFVDLIFAVASDEKESHGHHSRLYVKQKGQKEGLDGVVLESDCRGGANDGIYNAVSLTQEARDAINRLHLLIGKMLPAAYEAGMKHGRSVLYQLAAGEVSQSDFDGVKKR